MNEDQANQCLDLGIQCLKKNDFEQAIKYFHKSIRLHPSEKAWKLVAQCEELKKRHQESQKHQQNSHTDQQTRHRTANGHTNNHNSHQQTQKNYTPEQAKFVTEFLKKKDFYEMLGVSRSATDDELKKAYRKLALKLHPDKNKAPQADDAFKKLSKAYECLTNPDKKSYYDRTGRDEPEAQRQYERSYEFSGFQGGHMDAEDLFDFLFQGQFGSQFNRQRQYQQSQQRQQQYRQRQREFNAQQQQFFKLFQYLPIIFIIFSFLAFNFNTTEQNYNTVKTYKYNKQLFTKNIHAPYYVDQYFEEKYRNYPNKLKEVEDYIEQDYATKVYKKCLYNQRVKQSYEYQARLYTGEQRKLYQREADNVDNTNCEEFARIKDKIQFSIYF